MFWIAIVAGCSTHTGKVENDAGNALSDGNSDGDTDEDTDTEMDGDSAGGYFVE
jgi:hypothetical protein